MTRDGLIGVLVAKAEADERVIALLLGGSLGAGRGDAFSDVDLILVVAPAAHGALVAEISDWIGVEVVHWMTPYPGLPLFCGVTPEWLRFDLTVTVPGRVLGAQNGLRPLVDRAGIWAALPPTLEPKPIAREALEALVRETLRILGLLPVSIGREDYAVGVSGAGLLRGQLIALMVAMTEPAVPPGALHLARILPAEDYIALENLTPTAASREGVIGASVEIAGLFIPRAKRLAKAVGLAWPTAMENAVRDHWRRSLGLDWPGDLC